MSKRVLAAIAALSISGGAALAQEVKVGVVLPYTGIGAEFARQMDRGMELYLKLNPDQVKPYTITFIKRDSKAPSGADAKIAVQELLTQDKVDALAGWGYSPDAIASTKGRCCRDTSSSEPKTSPSRRSRARRVGTYRSKTSTILALPDSSQRP